MNKYRITYPNNKEVRDDTSRTTKSLNVKYRGKFEDVKVYETNLLCSGKYKYGVSLPPSKIVVGTGAYNNSNFLDLLQHEYGHILQAKVFGLKAYYGIIAPASLKSMSTNSSMHYKYWTEILANNFAKKYFTYDYALSKYFPQGNVKLPWSLVVLSLIR